MISNNRNVVLLETFARTNSFPGPRFEIRNYCYERKRPPRDSPMVLLSFSKMILKLPGLLLTYYAVIVKYKLVFRKLPIETFTPMILIK